MSLSGKKYECPACGMKFASEAELRQHGAVHMKPQPAAFAGLSCPACGASFDAEPELHSHADQIHRM